MVTKMVMPAVVLVLLILTVAILRRSVRSGSSATSVATQFLTLERKLEVLADCGFRLSEPFTQEDLLKSWPREKLEKPGFETLLLGLGMTEGGSPGGTNA